jgi:GMP reductase
MRIENEIKLDYSDVLICPKRSESPSRKNVVLSRRFNFLNSGVSWEGVPVVAANMSTVGTFGMARALSGFGMPVCLHKHYSVDELVEFFKGGQAFYTLGINDEDFEKINAFSKANRSPPDLICLDVANGYTKYFVEKCRQIRSAFPNSVLMAGNVCTPEMVQELLLAGGVDRTSIVF